MVDGSCEETHEQDALRIPKQRLLYELVAYLYATPRSSLLFFHMRLVNKNALRG